MQLSANILELVGFLSMHSRRRGYQKEQDFAQQKEEGWAACGRSLANLNHAALVSPVYYAIWLVEDMRVDAVAQLPWEAKERRHAFGSRVPRSWIYKVSTGGYVYRTEVSMLGSIQVHSPVIRTGVAIAI